MLKKESKLKALGRKLGFRSRGKASATTAGADAASPVPAAAALSDPPQWLGPLPPTPPTPTTTITTTATKTTTTAIAQPVNTGLKARSADITIAAVTAEVYYYGVVHPPSLPRATGVCEAPVPTQSGFHGSTFAVDPGSVEKHLAGSQVTQPIAEQQGIQQPQPDQPAAVGTGPSTLLGLEDASQHRQPEYPEVAGNSPVVQIEKIPTSGDSSVIAVLHLQPGETTVDCPTLVQALPSSTSRGEDHQSPDDVPPTSFTSPQPKRNEVDVAVTELPAKLPDLGSKAAATGKKQDGPITTPLPPSPTPVSDSTTPAAAAPLLQPTTNSPLPKPTAPPPTHEPAKSAAEAVRAHFTQTANVPLSQRRPQQVEARPPLRPAVSAAAPGHKPTAIAQPPEPVAVIPSPESTVAPAPPPPPPPPPEPTPLRCPTSLRDIPIELLQIVLLDLPDFRSLMAAARSCGPLFRAVKSAKMLLATHVIKKELPEGVFPAAFLAARSSSPMPHIDRDKHIMAFIDVYLRQRNMAVWRVTLEEARWISKFKHVVVYFSDAHLKFALGQLKGQMPRLSIYSPALAWSANPTTRPISATEFARSARTFYLFETYRNLFKDSDDLGEIPASVMATLQKSFFNSFAPWEIEQLAAAMNYLAFSVIAPGLQLVCSKYSVWFERLPQSTGRRELFQYHLLSRGLQYLMGLAKKPKHKFHRYVDPPMYSEGRFKSLFLDEAMTYQAFRDKSQHAAYPRTPLGDIFKEFFTDVDGGAMHAWEWSYADGERRVLVPSCPLVNAPTRQPCRRLALVMWDMVRIHEIGFMNENGVTWLGRGGNRVANVWEHQERNGSVRVDPEERRIFGEGYHDDYQGPIFVNTQRVAGGYNFPDDNISYRY